jgi:predicted nucleotidyltransferase component of viral defense system
MEPYDPRGYFEQIMGGGAVIFSSSEVSPIAAYTGFRAEMIEKVLHLLNLLDKLNRHPMLKGKWVLKGGTALNLFLFDLPRLSVDIDLNYVGALEREAMLADRRTSGSGGIFPRRVHHQTGADRTCRREVAVELPELHRAKRQSRS